MHPTNHTSLQNNSAGRRHICIVTETYPPEVNGVALTLRNWAERLRRDGYLVSIVRPRQQSFDSSPVSYDPMVTLVPGLPLPGYNGLQFGLPAAGRLSRYWKQHRPDVVYVATEGPLGWSAMRVARRLGIRIFSGFHTSFHSYLKHYHVGWLHFPLLRYLCWFTIEPSAPWSPASSCAIDCKPSG
jgi:glycosyltransferase involved in cell wall biosynthesis